MAMNNQKMKAFYFAWKSYGLIVIIATSILYSNTAFGKPLKVDNTLKSEKTIIIKGTLSDLIKGGAKRGENLFHSFQEFNIDEDTAVYFFNPQGIKRIITRITGNNRSDIMGVLGVNGGADLFIINPNGITFGPNSSLDLNGSLLVTTANSVIFEDSNTQFSANPPSESSLLSSRLPVGLKFRDTTGQIINQSNLLDPITEEPIGLQVKPGNTLAFVGGDIEMNGGILTAPDGFIELGSISGQSKVSLNSLNFKVGYEEIKNFGFIKLRNNSFIISEGQGSGDISLQGQQINISAGSIISALNIGSNSGGTIKIKASDDVIIEGFLNGFKSGLLAGAAKSGNGADIIISSKRLILRDNAFIQASSTFFADSSGVKIPASGSAGNIIVNAKEIEIGNGASISAETEGTGKGGSITINDANVISISDSSVLSSISKPIPSLDSGGRAGDITLNTKFLKISNNSSVNVNGEGNGSAGTLTLNAKYVLLDNYGSVSADTKSGAGNIVFNDADTIILRNNSFISTNAENTTGGNITINTGVLAALENSDITANAIEGGKGGKVSVTAQGVFGTEVRADTTPESDITASSTLGAEFSGTVDLNITNNNPTQGLFELPTTVIDANKLVANNACRRSVDSSFINSGRGGLPPSLSENLNSSTSQVSLVEPVLASADNSQPKATETQTTSLTSSSSTLVPAQGWVFNDKGEVVLVAYNSAVEGPQRLQTTPAGCPVQ